MKCLIKICISVSKFQFLDFPFVVLCEYPGTVLASAVSSADSPARGNTRQHGATIKNWDPCLCWCSLLGDSPGDARLELREQLRVMTRVRGNAAEDRVQQSDDGTRDPGGNGCWLWWFYECGNNGQHGYIYGQIIRELLQILFGNMSSAFRRL